MATTNAERQKARQLRRSANAVPQPEMTENQQQAWRAAKRFRKMLPAMTGMAKAVAQDRSVRVRVNTSSGSVYTDGQTIYLPVPFELGVNTPHDRMNCGTRARDGQQVCVACQQDEDLMVKMYHELSHHIFGTFQKPTDTEVSSALRDGVNKYQSKLSKLAQAKFTDADWLAVRKSYLGVAALVSPFGPMLVNALEDVRVNTEMFRTRPGLRKMFEVWTHQIMDNGIPSSDGERINSWHDAEPNAQIMAGIFCVAAGYKYKGWFSPEIERDLADERLGELADKVNSAGSVSDVYGVMLPVLDRLQEMGYCLEQASEEPSALDRKPEKSDDNDDSSSSDGEKSESQEGDSETPAEAESSDGESDSDSGGEQEEADGESGDGADESGSAGDEQSEGDASSETSGNSGDGADDGESDDDTDGSSGSGSDSDSSDPSGEAGSSDAAGGNTGDGSDNASERPDTPEEDKGETTSGRGSEDSQSPSTGSADESTQEQSDPDGGVREDHPGSENQSGQLESGNAPDGSDDSRRESEVDLQDGDSDQDESDSGQGSGADDGSESVEGKAADQAIQIDQWVEMGSPEMVDKAMKIFGGHETPDGEEVDSVFALTPDEDALVRPAANQSGYFETPSINVEGVVVHRYGVPDADTSRWGRRNNSWAQIEDYRQDGYTDQQLRQHGLMVDSKIAESVLGKALLRTRLAFEANARKANQRDLKRGRVDPSKLAKRAPLGDSRIFAKPILPGKRSYHVIIGIDISGSTAGEEIKLSKLAALGQAELLNRVGVPFEIWAHTTSGGFHSTNMDMYEVKALDAPWDSKHIEALTTLAPMSGNLDGHSIEFYRKRLDMSLATDKVLMYYTDGAMPASNYDEELEILQREIRYCQQHKYTLMAVGIRTDSPEQHGLDTVQIDEIDDLVKVVTHLEKRLH